MSLNARFVVSPRFELFFALETLADAGARIHRQWKQRTLVHLPAELRHGIEARGSAFWVALADALGSEPDLDTVDAIVAVVDALPIEELKRRLLLGQLHSRAIVEALLSGDIDLREAIARLPVKKREWLAFIDLYPHEGETPAVRTLQQLLDEPEGLRRQCVGELTRFWKHAFAGTWRILEPELRRSCAEKERLFHSLSLSEFVRAALLRVEVDEGRKRLKAIRGGYTLPLDRIVEAVFMPSAFNDRRYWSAYDEADGRVHVYLPWFDPSIDLDRTGSLDTAELIEPEIDAAMVFRALGDSTRFAMISLLAQRPRSSIELAKALGVSKATVSHHVYQLREAGLLDEISRGGSTELSVRRATLEQLSAITLKRLFETGSAPALGRSRKSR